MPANPRTPKFKMPSVYRPKNENCFRCKVGYYVAKNGKRERREFRLGDDELLAHKQALSLAEKWLKEEQRHRQVQATFAEVFPTELVTLPVWTGTPEAEAAARDEYLSTAPEDLPGDENVTALAETISVQMASQTCLERLLGRAKRDAKAFATYRWYEREFRLGLVPGAIDPRLSVNALKLKHVETYCEYWCDLASRAADTEDKEFGWRSAWNRLDAFAFLLRDLRGRDTGFGYPERADEVFKEAKATVAGSLTAIQAYDPETMKAVLRKSDDRLRTCIYCALNFGMYQSDIGQQLRRRHTPEDGGLIDLGGEAYLQWHRHKLKRRQRALMRQDDREKPVLLTHFVWPETLKLLNAHAAPEANPLNLWLLNSNGLPLWRHEPHHKRPVDNISTAHYRAVADAEVRLPFDQIRKFGATACESMASVEVQQMYRGERRAGSSRVYVLQDFVGKLTPFLRTWAERLRADGVLY